MKILSVIITTPDYNASGAVNAAIKLSEEVAKLGNLELAIMSNKDRSAISLLEWKDSKQSSEF